MSLTKVTPNLDKRSTKILNLTVLQRIDPCIEQILITASLTSFYEFNVDLMQWSRKEVEGSLFVVKRNAQPKFQFIVMNRKSTENLVEDLSRDFEFEVQVPYLLYRNAAKEIKGMWFYIAHECEEVADLFGRILGAYSKVPPKPQLRKSEFKEHEEFAGSTVTEGPLEPAFTTSTAVDVAEASPFKNSVSTAATVGHTSSNIANLGQPYHCPAKTIDPSLLVPTPLSLRVPTPLLSPTPTLQVSIPVPSAPSLHTQPRRDSVNLINSTNRPANLVKPSFFTPPASPILVTTPTSSAISTSALYPHVNPQYSHGTPLVQPFPPPTPPQFLTFDQIPPNSGPLTRQNVQDSLLMLAQDNQFIDLVYQMLLKVHRS